jgi:hypothetical protein
MTAYHSILHDSLQHSVLPGLLCRARPLSRPQPGRRLGMEASALTYINHAAPLSGTDCMRR